MQSHFRIFTQFCSDLGVRPLPVQPETILRYISFLSATGRSYGTVQNHISTIKHYHRLFGFPPGWENLYSFQLALRGCKRFLGAAPARKLAITPILLSRMVSLFDATQPLQAAMRALFLVASFLFYESLIWLFHRHVLIPLKSHGVRIFTCHSTGLFSTFTRLRPFSFFSGPYAFHSLVSQVLRFVPLPLFNIIFVSTQFVHPIHFFPFCQVPITLRALLLFVIFPVF